MSSHAEPAYEIDVEDVEYLRHGDRPLLARLMIPRGLGPVPTLVEAHGGAWHLYDRTRLDAFNRRLAALGVAVAAIDFRMPPEAPYPASLADLNFALRWVKAHAADLGTDSDLVCVGGNSSGGHQAMLAAMRPHDARYAALPLPPGLPSVDATVRCAVLLYPVIDPLGRYHYAKRLVAEGTHEELADRVLPGHAQYWQTEEAMAEGNPVLALERGEDVELPAVLYLQSSEDIAHPSAHIDRFVSLYRKAGGRIELELTEGPTARLRNDLDGPAMTGALKRIRDFVHEACSLAPTLEQRIVSSAKPSRI